MPFGQKLNPETKIIEHFQLRWSRHENETFYQARHLIFPDGMLENGYCEGDWFNISEKDWYQRFREFQLSYPDDEDESWPEHLRRRGIE